MDARRDLQWSRTFGGSGLDFGFMAVEAGDWDLLIAGESPSKDFWGMTSRGGTDAVIIRVASDNTLGIRRFDEAPVND